MEEKTKTLFEKALEDQANGRDTVGTISDIMIALNKLQWKTHYGDATPFIEAVQPFIDGIDKINDGAILLTLANMIDHIKRFEPIAEFKKTAAPAIARRMVELVGVERATRLLKGRDIEVTGT